MAMGNATRGILPPLLFVNLVMYIIVLGLAGWSVDKFIDGETHHHLGGNTSTRYLLTFSLLAGAVGGCSVFAGILHVRAGRVDSLASAYTSALVSWALIGLSFGLTCKQIILGGNRGRRLRTLEAFVTILTLTQTIYLVLLAGIMNSRYRPRYPDYVDDYGMMAPETLNEATGTAPSDV